MTTIRDPQTDVSTADYSIGGEWDFAKKLTYTSALGFTNNQDIVDKQYVDSRVVGSVDEDRIYYIGKHGNDVGNDGKNIEEAFLTIQKGIDEAFAQTPTLGDEFVVRINDGGSYDTFDLTGKPYINIDGSGALLRSTGGAFTLGGQYNKVSVNGIYSSVVTPVLVNVSGTGDECYLKCHGMGGLNIAIGISVVSGGSFYADIGFLNVISSNTGIELNSSSNASIKVHFWAGKIIVKSGSTFNLNATTVFGDIDVETGGNLYITINGEFTGNIIAASGATVKMEVGSRSTHSDSIDDESIVNISYIGQSNQWERNRLVGGDYEVNPRQETPLASIVGLSHTQYVADNTMALLEVPSAIGLVPSVAGTSILALKVNTIGNYFGIFLPIENRDMEDMAGGVGSISFRSRWYSGATMPLRAALLSWTGSPNGFPTDPIASWSSTPTLIANWNYENTPSDLVMPALGTFVTHKIENIPIDSSNVTNLAVFIWNSSSATTLNAILEFSNIRCNKGPYVLDFAPRSQAEELLLCQRYYNKSYDSTVTPGSLTYDGSQSVSKGVTGTTPYIGMNIRFATQMFLTPTITPYSPVNGAAGYISIEGSSDVAASGARVGRSGGQIVEDSPTSGTFFASYHWVADSRF